MKPNSLLLSMLGALCAGLCFTFATARAQSTPEEQAKVILQLFESGQKDSAYALLEPLKKTARFVPAVMYTRAQMTPDDRALGLYKELIALDPASPWAEKSAYQLVVRYTDKRDSQAAYLWTGVLKTSYARSPLVANAEELVGGVKSWRGGDEGGEAGPVKGKSGGKDPHATASHTVHHDSTTKKVTPKITQKVTPKPHADSSAAQAARHWYALQVGLYPTKEEATTHVTELKKKSLTASALPKVVDGRKQYALVVGRYATIDDAQKKKPTINKSCGCTAFVVRIQ